MSVKSLSSSTIESFAVGNKFSGPSGISALTTSAVSSTTGSPTITTNGGATIYSYTGDGSMVLTDGGTCDILVVGGGGAGAPGASSRGRSGGGGGGVAYYQDVYIPAGTATITVGAGGAIGLDYQNSYAGGASAVQNGDSFVLIAPGGGGGHRDAISQGGSDGGSGSGSFGGGTGESSKPGRAISSWLGNDGGNGYMTDSASCSGGGGGGAGGVGGNASSNRGGNGGVGRSISITGSSVIYSPGGAGSSGNDVDGTNPTGQGTAKGSGGEANQAGVDGIVIVRIG